jgi:hypothetical protein
MIFGYLKKTVYHIIDSNDVFETFYILQLLSILANITASLGVKYVSGSYNSLKPMK